MTKILKSEGISIEGKTVYDGSRSSFFNTRQNSTKNYAKELTETLKTVPTTVRQYILELIDNYKKEIKNEFDDKRDIVFRKSAKDGHTEGLNKGNDEALKLVNDSVKNIVNAANSIEQFKNVIYRDAKNDIIDLTLSIAQTIVKQTVTTNYDALRVIIADAINKASETVNFTICLNTSDYNVINKNPDLTKYITTKETNIKFLSDPNILPGDAIIKTDFGEIDARLSSQIEQIKKAFMKITPD